MSKPQEVRVRRITKGANLPKQYAVLAVWGCMDTRTYFTHDWRGFLARKGWEKAPRVWEWFQT